MIPIEVWGIIFTISFLLVFTGFLLKQLWARMIGSLLLMASGIVLLWGGGIQTGYLLTSQNPIVYEAVGVATSTSPWLFAFGVTIILIGFLTIFWGGVRQKKVDPIFG